MSELPPTIDTILESIRARMCGEAEAPPAPPPPAPPLTVPPAVQDSVPDLDTPGLGQTGMTLDGLVRQMLEPMLQRWLDENLPEIVTRVAQTEIRRISGR